MTGKTGRRRTKAQLTDAQIRSMAEFPEENPNPVLRVAEDGRVLYANRPAQALLDAFGWRTGQPLPQPLPDAVRRVLDGVGSEIDLTDPHERVWSFALAAGACERHVNLYARDVTGRKHAEEALRKSHEELEERVRERTAELVGANKELGAEIAERIKAGEAAKAERQRLNDLLEILPVYVVLLTPEYHVPFANRFFRERFGESHGKRCFEYLFGRTEPCEICETYTVLKTNAPHRWEWTGPDGRNYDIFDFPFTDTDGSTLIMEMGIDITEHKQAEEARRRGAERFKLLSEVTAQLLVSQNPQAIVERLCREVMEHLDCDCFFNFLADEASGRLRLNAFAGIPPEEARKIEWLDYGVGVCGCVARQGCRIVAEDIQHTDDPRTELVKSFGIQAYACHPLLGQGRVIGTLSFGARSRTMFTADELALMKTVADQVAVAMQHIQSQQVLRRAHDELEQRVAERTLELLKVNEELTEEIEEHARLLEALRKSEARLAEAQRIAHLGGWDWNVATDELSWSMRCSAFSVLRPSRSR
jgi:PAS domain-containing protein